MREKKAALPMRFSAPVRFRPRPRPRANAERGIVSLTKSTGDEPDRDRRARGGGIALRNNIAILIRDPGEQRPAGLRSETYARHGDSGLYPKQLELEARRGARAKPKRARRPLRLRQSDRCL